MRPWRALPLVLALGALACEDAALTDASPGDDGTPPDIIEPGPDAGIEPGPIIVTNRIREDFDSRLQVDPERSFTAFIDTNRGVARLPSEGFPTLETSGLVTLEPDNDYEGVLEAGSIVVSEDTFIDAKDSAELRAQEILRISGRIRAGAGGVTLIAGRAIYVDGTIESQGPITLRVASEDGSIEIDGRVMTLGQPSEPSAKISLLARGEIEIRGELHTGESREADSGNVELTSYGPITIDGPEAIVASGPSIAERAGRIILSTESEVVIASGASLAVGQHITRGESMLGDGTPGLEIRAVGDISVTGSSLQGGDTIKGEGGAVYLAAAGEISLEASTIRAGKGPVGGTVVLEADTAILGPEISIAGGEGERAGGPVLIGTASDLTIRSGAQLIGGDSDCGPGGSLTIEVGGSLEIEETAALIGGGATGDAGGTSCVDEQEGGNVQVTAQDGTEARIREAAIAGLGGNLAVDLDRSYTRSTPDVRVRAEGWIISAVFDRGEDARGVLPRLIDAAMITPQGTFAKIQLAGSDSPDGPFDSWSDARTEAQELLRRVADARFFRYRVWLKGRALDTPEVDYFEIELAP